MYHWSDLRSHSSNRSVISRFISSARMRHRSRSRSSKQQGSSRATNADAELSSLHFTHITHERTNEVSRKSGSRSRAKTFATTERNPKIARHGRVYRVSAGSETNTRDLDRQRGLPKPMLDERGCRTFRYILRCALATVVVSVWMLLTAGTSISSMGGATLVPVMTLLACVPTCGGALATLRFGSFGCTVSTCPILFRDVAGCVL